MFYNTRLMLALGCVGLTALSIPAVSTPNPRGVESQVRVPIPRETTRAPQQATKPAVNAPVYRPGIVPRASVASKPATNTSASKPSAPPASPAQGKMSLSGWPRLVSEARRYIGTNPTDMKSRWCARFLNLVLAKTGYAGTGSDAARSFASYGEKISQPKVGAIAVLSRGNNRNLGHVGVISGFDPRGNPIIISGNHGRRVGEAAYPRSRVVAYVMPTTRGRAPVLGRLAPPPLFQLASRSPAPAAVPTVVRRAPAASPQPTAAPAVHRGEPRRYVQQGSMPPRAQAPVPAHAAYAKVQTPPQSRVLAQNNQAATRGPNQAQVQTPAQPPRRPSGDPQKPAFVAKLESNVGKLFASSPR